MDCRKRRFEIINKAPALKAGALFEDNEMLKPVTPGKNGISFYIGKILFEFNFARSGTWGKYHGGNEQSVSLFLIKYTEKDDARLIQIIIVPFKIYIGWIIK